MENTEPQNNPPNTPFLDPKSHMKDQSDSSGHRNLNEGFRGTILGDDSPANPSKSPLRMQYLAESKVIQNKIGNLEDVRGQLGLTQRKMCQLLLVDPSAWTRWQKQGKAPPHIYRSLQWYMALIERHPEWHPQNSFNRVFDKKHSIIETEMAVLTHKMKRIEGSMRRRDISYALAGFALGALSFSLGIFILS